MTDSANLPLDGIRILDFTQVMLGPCATQMLADFGADVIKVERPMTGDLSRSFFGETSEEAMNNAVFSSLNRNKRSIEIDTKSEAGKQLVLDLVRFADVVVDNFRAGVMQRLGFDYDALKKSTRASSAPRAQASARRVHMPTRAGRTFWRRR